MTTTRRELASITSSLVAQHTPEALRVAAMVGFFTQFVPETHRAQCNYHMHTLEACANAYLNSFGLDINAMVAASNDVAQALATIDLLDSLPN
jgi:hypothetical protein